MKNGKKSGLLDVFIVLMIVFGAVGVLLRMQMLRVTDSDEEEALITLTVEHFHTRGLDCVELGETLYTAGGEVYGEIAELSYTPETTSLLSDGVLHTGTPEDTTRVRLSVRVSLTGRAADGVFLREGKYAVMVGERVTLYGERCELRAIVSWVEVS